MKGLRIKWLEGITEIAMLAPLKRMDELESGNSEVDNAKALNKLQEYFRKGASFVAAEVDSYSVGFGIGTPRENFYLINKIYVLPGFRGKGIGTEIERAQMVNAKRLGFQGLESYVAWVNKSSIRVQEKLGAEKIFSNPRGCIFRLAI